MSKLDELIDLLDQNIYIKNINSLSHKVSDDTKKLIKEYQENPSIELKKKILEDHDYRNYLECETNINCLIMGINNKFKRGHLCANHKW